MIHEELIINIGDHNLSDIEEEEDDFEEVFDRLFAIENIDRRSNLFQILYIFEAF